MAVTSPDELWWEDVLFVPVRHHSPACAFALAALLEEVRPKAVLIEGPQDLNALRNLLLDGLTQPPVAAFCQTGPEGDRRSSFFPLCEYSPEWIGLKEGSRLGAEVAFIDLPFAHKAWNRQEKTDGRAASLLEESRLFHNRYVEELALRSGCRDGDELWERLFELRTRSRLRDWRSFFGEVHAYCRMAREGYTEEALRLEGDLDRERCMAEGIRAWRARVGGPLVVVTGGFHSSGLRALLGRKGKEPSSKGVQAEDAWLIRYSFEQLDALNGYSSGMPSPAYHQRIWEGLRGDAEDFRDRIAVACLTELARASREKGFADPISTVGVQAAVVQASRLAELRGHAGPGREDLLDAIRSCFLKGAVEESSRAFITEVKRFLGGSRLGNVPPSAGSPPLVQDARRLAAAHGVRLEDTDRRTARLDLYRNPRHLMRSRFFHRMNYLGVPLARWQGGPDFLCGTKLDLLFEEWSVAWSPLVEARLVELAPLGASLEEVALAALRKEEIALEAEGRSRSASAVVMLALRACLIGLQDRLPELLERVRAHLEEDASFDSVVLCGHHLATLWRGREPLGAMGRPEILHLLRRTWDTALFLLPTLRDRKEEGEAESIAKLLELRELGRGLAGIEEVDPALLQAGLSALASEPRSAPGIAGACAALLYLDGAWEESRLRDFLAGRFGAGAEAHGAVRCFSGLVAAGPELLWRVESLMPELDRLLQGWDEEAFLRYLPDLRLVFSRLNPRETARVGGLLAALHGMDAEALEVSTEGFTEGDVLAGARLNQELGRILEADGLAAWVVP